VPCFRAATPIRAAESSQRIDRIRQDDLVWSRDEHDPDGLLVLKRV